MVETYCGKSCDACKQKEDLHCEGCRVGPGKYVAGDCEIAQCCREKGHESCETCSFESVCGTHGRRWSIPDNRQSEIQEEAERKAKLAKRAPFMSKWLWLLFWLVVPSGLSAILTNETLVEWVPGLYLPGQVLSALCSVAYGAILLRLASENDQYRTSGLCCLAAAAVSFVVVLATGGKTGETWTLVLTLPAAVVALIGEYYEYCAHSEVLYGVDSGLSEDWRRLWKWYIGTLGGLIGSMIVLVIVPVLGIIALLAAAIGAVVVSILKLVYLYRSAKLFRELETKAN